MHLEVLASDSFLGRDTGKKGQKLAAAYLRDRFVEMGIAPIAAEGIKDGYFQTYELIEERKGSIRIIARGRPLRYPDQVLYLSESISAPARIDELVLIHAGDSAAPAVAHGARHILLMMDGKAAISDLRSILASAGIRDAQSVFVAISPDEFALLRSIAHPDATRMRLPDAADQKPSDTARGAMQLFFLTRDGCGRLLGLRGARRLDRLPTGAALSASIRLAHEPRSERIVAENVLAYIEGGDAKDELIVITAHYDHIGVEQGVVYNGADDDGSGTAALLEIAQAFSRAKAQGHGPRRSILIMPVSGEEKGLLGSRYYSDHPVFPLESTVADLNIDMIGRTDSAHADSAPYIYIIGSDRLSTELHAVNEEANRRHVGLVLDYTFNAEDDPNRFYYRSDHYNFARKGIPSIFYFSGVHEDYHQPGDDVDKIRFDLLEQRARLVFHTAWELANRPVRIAVDARER